MSLSRSLIAFGATLLLAAGTSAASANQTGNRNNNPAAIQSTVPEETGSIGMHAPRAAPSQRSAAPASQHKPCRFNGDESGDRNPDFVTCYE